MKVRFISVLLVLIFSSTLVSAQESLKWRIFTSNNKNVWFTSSSELFFFSPSSFAIRPVNIDPVRKVKSIRDAVEYDNFLFISTDTGLYKLDMNNAGSERISFPDEQIISGKIAVDMDYLWLLTDNTLHCFDRLADEWQTYDIPSDKQPYIGIYSDGDKLFCVSKTNLHKFTISTEKWTSTELNAEFLESSYFYSSNTSLNLIDRNFIRRYIPASFSWETTEVQNPITDFFDEDTVVYYTDGSSLMRLTTANGINRVLDIPQTGNIHAVTKIADTLLLAAQKRLLKYNINTEAVDFIDYDTDLDPDEIEKVYFKDNFVVIIYRSFLAVYDAQNRVWKKDSRKSIQQKTKTATWDDEGLTVRYKTGYQSVLAGYVEENISLKRKGYDYDTLTRGRIINDKMVYDTLYDSVSVYSYSIPSLPLMNLNLRTTDPHDRSMELFFDNTSSNEVPKKGIYYKGNRNDRLNSIQAGTTTNDQLSSQTLPSTQLEGASIVLESKERVKGRDRKVLRAAAGSGYITTKTQWRTLKYQSSGTYYLLDKPKAADSSDQMDTDTVKSVSDTTRIIPGTVRVWVDGELLDSTKYTFYNDIGKLQFTTDAPVDPVAIITVQYKIQTIPDGRINDVEFIPAHSFGLMHYGSVNLSPREWISTRIGFAGFATDTLFSSADIRKPSPVVNILSPIELRGKNRNLFFKLTPDFSYNMKSGARAGSVALQSRFGDKTGLVINGMFADSNFTSTDTFTFGYGAIKNQFDLDLTHDITKDIPVSYYQHYRHGEHGTEKRFSSKAGLHKPGLPFFDVSASRTIFDSYSKNDTSQSVFDSLFNTKDKIYMRLYETSSSLLENLINVRKFSYDISHSEYRTEFGDRNWKYGRMSTAILTVNPVHSVTVSGNLLYRSGMDTDSMPSSTIYPGLEIQTTDFPNGIDISALYYLQFNKYESDKTSSDSITGSLGVIMKPGQWFSPLRWFSPRFNLSQKTNTSFNTVRPRLHEIITGQNGKHSSTTIGGFGFNVFPSDAILFRNFNEWTVSDTISYFSTENDFQFWPGSRNYWQIIWNFTELNNYHSGYLSYDRIITPWLRTAPKLNATYSTDSTGKVLEAGPTLTVNLNFQNVSFLKSLFNSHDFSIVWKSLDGEFRKKPGIGYTFNLSAVIVPNIQINNFESFTFKNNELSDFQSRLTMIVNF